MFDMTTTNENGGLIHSARALFAHEAAGGIVLMAAAAVALALSNSPFFRLYDLLLETRVVLQVGEFALDKPLLLWINDGLMAVFFFLVGLEIKREVVEGRLSSLPKAALPVIAAVGGMIVPALIYVALNRDDAAALHGWAIPAATDIAFAVGILALLGRRVPPALKVFLLALAIIDDLGAIVIIAAFYTSDLSLSILAVAALGVAVLAWLNHRGVASAAPYVVTGLVVWVCVLKSGVHATLAGVVVALFVPLCARDGRRPLEGLEHGLSPWVSFGILPLFAFANAGVALHGLSLDVLAGGITLGIAVGLFVGKQVGIMGFVWASVRLGLARLPDGVGWAPLYGTALLAGIGFTMSLFIGTLAFADPTSGAAVRIGVLLGSIVSAVSGFLVLNWTLAAASEAVDRRRTEAAPAGRL
jgi:NhaA family Na+:H+ antiporter